jgi:hypothetical protein
MSCLIFILLNIFNNKNNGKYFILLFIIYFIMNIIKFIKIFQFNDTIIFLTIILSIIFQYFSYIEIKNLHCLKKNQNLTSLNILYYSTPILLILIIPLIFLDFDNFKNWYYFNTKNGI